MAGCGGPVTADAPWNICGARDEEGWQNFCSDACWASDMLERAATIMFRKLAHDADCDCEICTLLEEISEFLDPNRSP